MTQSPRRVLVLADDLTGAIEAGAKFAAVGIASVVTSERTLAPAGLDPRIPALVIDTESRHLPPRQAGERVERLARAARKAGLHFICKKTDSTLRGNIGSELEALLAAWPAGRVVFAPAYPALGRTVKDARLHVNGRPLGETEFAGDRLNPACESHIPTVLASQSTAPVFAVSERVFAEIEGPAAEPGAGQAAGRVPVPRPHPFHAASAPGIYVYDAESDEQVRQAVRAAAQSSRPCLLAGPASVAEALAAFLTGPRFSRPQLPRAASCLVINGSLHPASREQVRCAEASGFRRMTGAEFASLSMPGRGRRRPRVGSAEFEDRGQGGVPGLRPGRAAGSPEACYLVPLPGTPDAGWLLATACAEEGSPAGITRRLGEMACAALARTPLDMLVVFGGDTARGVVDALKGPLVYPLGEFIPGVPVSRIARESLPAGLAKRERDLYLVTKAGGFGAPDLLVRLREAMK